MGPGSRLGTASTPDIAGLVGLPREEILGLEDLGEHDPAPVYLSGSLVAGYGNAWSDVDVFVVAERAPVGPYAKRADTNYTSAHFVRDKRVDFEFWSPRDVEALARRVDSLELGTGKLIPGTGFLHIEECFVHRLRIGVPIHNADAFERLRERFDFDRFRAYQTEEAIRYLDAVLEDAAGMIEAGDRDVALFTGREVVGTAIDAYCHWLGNTDPVRKWRVRHLQEARDDDQGRRSEIEEAFWRLEFPDAGRLREDGEGWRAYVEECMRFANRVVAWVHA